MDQVQIEQLVGVGTIRADEDLSEAMRLLRRGVVVIDRAWDEARTASAVDALALAEASQGVHRALVALSSHLPDRPPAPRAAAASNRPG